MNLRNKRSLSMDRLTAWKIEHDPEKKALSEAKRRLKRWLLNDPEDRLFLEWTNILSKNDWPRIKKIIISSREHSRKLSRNSPFCNVLTSTERKRIFQKYAKRST